jgi:hypothetical protein
MKADGRFGTVATIAVSFKRRPVIFNGRNSCFIMIPRGKHPTVLQFSSICFKETLKIWYRWRIARRDGLSCFK